MAYVGNQPARGQWRKLTDISASFNGVLTTFTTSVPPGTSEYYVTAGTATQLLISLGGVIQQPDTDYTVSTNSITFTTPPTAGLSFFGVLCGDALNIGTPTDASVTTAKLAGGLSVGLTAGSASTAALYFTGDANTGIYSPGADQVAISTNGAGRLFVDSSGRVGIGNSSPGALLDISGAGNIVRLGDGTNTFDVRFKGPNNWTAQLDTSADKFNIQRNSTSLVTIDSAGRLGIGTTSPGELLHVYNSAATSRLIVGPNGTGAATPNALALEQENTGFTVCHVRNLYNNAGLGELRLGGYGFTTFTSGSSQTERARIDSSGRLLVGTSSARNIGTHDAKIQLEGLGYNNSTVQFIGNSNDSNGAYVFIGKSRGTTVGSTASVLNNDELGGVDFWAADGTNMIRAARMGAYVDGTPGGNDIPSRLVFSTTKDGQASPTSRFELSNLGIGALISENDCINLSTTVGANTSNVLIKGMHSGTAGAKYSGTTSFLVYTNGNVLNTNGSYTTISDAKLKENIVDAGSQWDDLKAVQIRNWNFKAETGHETHRQIGPIAQELETVCPGLVFETPDRDADGNETGEVTKGVNQSVLYMKAVKALQEAMERIEQLEAEMAAVKAQLS